MKRRKKVDNGLQIIIKMLNVESSIEFSVSVHLNVCVCVFFPPLRQKYCTKTTFQLQVWSLEQVKRSAFFGFPQTREN